MPQSQSEIHEVKPQPILTLAQAQYLPHYTMRETWVGLDGDERMTSQLISAGAKLDFMRLWERPWTAAWLERNAKKLSER